MKQLVAVLVVAAACHQHVAEAEFQKKANQKLTGRGRPPAESGAQQDISEIGQRTAAILKKNCHRCHGEGGKAKADFYVLVQDSLVPKRVKPGDPGGSLLIKMVRSGEMPEDDEPLSDSDQKVLEEWVRSGAADFNPRLDREFIPTNAVLETIVADLRRLNANDRPFARYITITHLYNAGLSDDELKTYRGALSKLVNSLSWRPKVVAPTAIDDKKTIFRIDLRAYRWSVKTWDAILGTNPYGVELSGPSARYCAQQTGTPLPFVRGDWIVFAASRPPLYHDILELPNSDAELERVLQVNVSENIRTRQVARAGFTESEVSDNNRMIERHESPLTRGAYWKSYDFKNNQGTKNLQAHPLGPTGLADNPFEQDGGEIIFSLPNGLQAYMLVDAIGKRIDLGPADVVHDDKQKGRLVVNGISCMSCHVQGMKFKEDVIRAHVEKSPGSFSADEVESIRALYPPADAFEQLQMEDARRFRDAVKETGVRITETDKDDPIVVLAKRFEANLNVKLAAAEVGLPVSAFLSGLEKSPGLSKVLGLLKVDGQTVKRDLFVRTFGALVRDLGLGQFIPPTARPISGPAVGDELGPFFVLGVTGPYTGPGASPWIHYHNRPLVMVFVRNLSPAVGDLTKKIDAIVARNRRSSIAAFLVLLSENPKSDEQKLRSFATDFRSAMPLTLIEGASGPKSYDLSLDAEVTVIMCRPDRDSIGPCVEFNTAFGPEQLDAKAIESVIEAIKQNLD